MAKQAGGHFYSTSFRENYGHFGVGRYYTEYGSSYRNPHEAKLRRVLHQMFDKWHTELALGRVMDLACGSGEVALMLREWWARRHPGSAKAIGGGAGERGKTEGNEKETVAHGEEQENAKGDERDEREEEKEEEKEEKEEKREEEEEETADIENETDKKEQEPEIVGCDPYTHAAYEERLGQPALTYSFEDIAGGALYDEEEFGTIFCCYAMHLVEHDRLYGLCQALAQAATFLVIVTPHKRPEIQAAMGWLLEEELLVDKVRMRRYRSVYR